MEAIEFRVSPDGQVYYKQGNSVEKRLTRFCTGICLEILDIIQKRFPGAWARLNTLYKPKNNSSAAKDVAAFSDRDIVSFEEVRCPLRGICQDERIICKPQSLYKLTPAEKEVAKLYLRGDTFDMIARELGKSPSTVKQQLWKLKNKLGTKNCREIIRVLRVHNI